MGVLRLYASIVHTLHANPSSATKYGLDQIAANAQRFAYIGNRRTLSKLVRQEAEELAQRLRTISTKQLETYAGADPSLAQTINAIRKIATNVEHDIVAEWYGRAWEKIRVSSRIFFLH